MASSSFRVVWEAVGSSKWSSLDTRFLAPGQQKSVISMITLDGHGLLKILAEKIEIRGI